jgi:hypothetical protein
LRIEIGNHLFKLRQGVWCTIFPNRPEFGYQRAGELDKLNDISSKTESYKRLHIAEGANFELGSV